MTLEELKDYPYVLKAIERYEDELTELYDDSAGSMSPDMSGMPHGSGDASSKVVTGYERNERRITELTEKLNKYRERLYKMDQFFDSIKDAHTLLIFELRFKEKYSWEQVAAHVGGNNTKDSVRQICNRYFEKNKNFK